jgi:hypothetical protein
VSTRGWGLATNDSNAPSSNEITVRHLGVGVDDALKIAEKIEA